MRGSAAGMPKALPGERRVAERETRPAKRTIAAKNGDARLEISEPARRRLSAVEIFSAIRKYYSFGSTAAPNPRIRFFRPFGFHRDRRKL